MPEEKSNNDEEKYYRAMINGLHGLLDDLDANNAPEDAKTLLREVVKICNIDFKKKFNLSQ